MKKFLLCLLLIIGGVTGKLVSQEAIKSVRKNHSEHSIVRSFSIDGDKYRIKEDNDRIHIAINNNSYDVEADTIYAGLGPAFQYVDKVKFENYSRNADNVRLLSQATRVYGFLWGEQAIVDWCSPYYKVGIYPNKIKKHFEAKWLKMENILRTAFGENWRKVADEMVKPAINIKNKQINDEYESTKRTAALYGEKLSKAEFCKLFDSNVNALIEYQDKLFSQICYGF